ncbi:hypothetical protein SEUCBS140593_002647 [Sporothrix eucalyptigena]|uniref:Propionyl-CoA synthetase n=1 Tax=Sporothrix eucalyptigena TaxID=1812306 RepID=A0ABP0B8I0_9PEZI
MAHPQDEVQRRSLQDPEAFWRHQADQLHWHRKPDVALKHTTKTLKGAGSGKDKGSEVTHDHWEWFPGGQISTCYNCVDRHVLAGRGEEAAILYDSPVTQTKQRITYAELLAEVETTAAVLREHGVKKGDVVLVYMPMVPAALIGILAINRLGAIHTVVFGGFAAAPLAQRIEDSRPAAVLTASCGIDGNKPPIAYRPFVEGAIDLSSWKPPHVLVWQRDALRWDFDVSTPTTAKIAGSTKAHCWRQLTDDARKRGAKAECVPVASTDGVYIIYTSGTTGKPKGVFREAGGHAVGLHLMISYLFNIHGPGDVMGCFSDIGWVVSHSYTLYGPLLTGAATVLYEGKPVGTPDASAFWRIVEEYGVSTMFTAPTALRAIRKDDPDNMHLTAVGKRGGLRTLRALFLAGERSEPTIITMYQQLLATYGAPGANVIDNWWSSESGSPISGIALAAHAGTNRGSAADTHKASKHAPPEPLAIKPGSAGKAMPGFDVRVVDDQGNELPAGKMGNIVLRMPLAPTALRTLWEDEERFYKGYLRRFDGRWLDTGDAGVIDAEGYINIMARSDDIINVAAHRLSTGSLEQAITGHPLVTEACVVSIPDALKGHMPFAFVNTTRAVQAGQAAAASDEALFKEINNRVREQVGGIASLGGLIEGNGMIPRTRSGKTLRRVLRELLENAVHGDFDAPVTVPSTVEDASVVEVARERIRAYFRDHAGDKHAAIESRAKL